MYVGGKKIFPIFKKNIFKNTPLAVHSSWSAPFKVIIYINMKFEFTLILRIILNKHVDIYETT